jgi:DNA helicase HerA-like ATPase
VTTTDVLHAQRRELSERFAVAQVAYAPDGRTVGFAGPLQLGVEIGGFAIVEQPDGGRLVVQVREVQVREREGLSIGLDVSDVVPDAVSANVRPTFRSLSGTATLVGRLDDGFKPLAATSPFGELPVRPADSSEVAEVVEGLTVGVPTVEVGTVAGTATTARLRASGFGRHTFMCGQSGSGKTYTTGVLFERLLAGTGLPIVVLDPNSDHVHLDSLRDPDDQSPMAQRYRQVASSVHVVRARGHEGSDLLCVDFSDLTFEVQARLLQLDPIQDLDSYAALRRVAGGLGPSYSVHALASEAARDVGTRMLSTRIDNLGLAEWALWRRDGESSIAHVDTGDVRCVVLDLGSLPRPAERALVALAVLGRRWARRAERTPVLLAVDEAHNVFPATTDDPLLQATSDLGTLIAGEGRKFGLHLFVATQRPGKVHPNVVSQCDNLVLMRMNGAHDVDELVTLFSHVPPAILRRALGFGLGEALFAGPITPIPMVARIGTRQTPEGGGDVPTPWAQPT